MSEYLNLSIMDKKMFITFIKWKKKNYMNLFYKKKKKGKCFIPGSTFNTVSKQLDKILVSNLPKCLHFCYEVLSLATAGYSSIKRYYFFFFFFFLLKDIHTHYKPKITVGRRLRAQNSLPTYLLSFRFIYYIPNHLASTV